MELRDLRYFVAVAEELHFTRAAARLNIAQPALSERIRLLEQEIGLALLERTKRHVELTPAGTVLLQEARAILSHARSAVQDTQRAARGELGQLKIGFIPWAEFTTSFLKVIRRFGEQRPDVRLDFHTMASPAPALAEGRVDVAFFAILDPLVGLPHKVICAEPIVVAMPRQHPLAKLRVVPLSRLASEPQIVVARERIGFYFDIVNRLCHSAGFDVQARHEIDHPQTTLSLVSAGVGVSLVPKSYENVDRPGVVYRPIRPSTTIKLVAAWRPEDRSAVLGAFREVLDDVVDRQS